MITPKITNLGYSNLWSDMSTILGYASNFEKLVAKLFANGEQGFFYDPNDLSTMFQNAAGTVPVTAVGQPVGRILDKSGRNNHAFQATSASRPILRKNAITGANYLEFDGSDDFLQTASIDFTGTDEVSLFAGLDKKVSGSIGSIFEVSSNPLSNYGTFGMYMDVSMTIRGVAGYSRGTVTVGAIVNTDAMNMSLSMQASISQKMIRMRTNGDSVISTNNQGGGKYGNYPIYIGGRGGISLPFNGHIYSLIGVGKLVSGTETLVIEKELAKRTGVTLSV